MGTLRGDNGGERPPDGGGLPDLPPEWGTIVIPDDAAELDHEAARLRREWRRTSRRNRWRRRLRLRPAPNRADHDKPSLGLPLLIMSIAIIATMTSLFALAWPNHTGARPTGSPTISTTAGTLPNLTLHTASGTPVRLRDNLPAVVLLVDGCSCNDLITAAVKAAPTQVTVIAVGRSAPSVPNAPKTGKLITVADPQATLRGTFGGSPPNAGVVALLVKTGGTVTRSVSSVTTVDAFRNQLTGLH
jgi:hypothetical protein